MPSGVEVQVLSRAPVIITIFKPAKWRVFLCYTFNMSKITNYLNEHLAGDVIANDNTLRQFSTDGSVLSLTPNLVVHPRVTDDVRKIARFTWRLAERGQVLPLTARGNGTDPTGAAIGRGTILSFPAHMSQIVEFDLKYRMVRVQPGIRLDALNQAVETHGLRLPIDGGNSSVMTVGGALATNLPGRQFAKYGCIRDWVDKLEVVLANGEIIQTGRIGRRELSEKKGLQTLEGEIYRAIDSLIDDNPDVVAALAGGSSLDASCYGLDMVRDENGGFDLTPLFLGSQGTLGIITQVILKLVEMPESDSMIVAALDGDENMSDLTNRMLELEPAALEFIDGDTLSLIHEITGCQPWHQVTKSLPYALMFIEFDDKHNNRKLKKAAKIMESVGIVDAKIAIEASDVESMMTVYDSVAAITNHNDNGAAAVPLVTDLAVSPENAFDVVNKIREALKRNHIQAGVWGNLGSGLITVRPVINLANLGQRQVVFRLMDQLDEIATKYDGSLTGCAGSGRLLMPWTRTQHDKETAEVMTAIKKIFDPYNVLNTGVDNDSLSREDVLAMLRQDYRQDRFAQYNLRG